MGNSLFLDFSEAKFAYRWLYTNTVFLSVEEFKSYSKLDHNFLTHY